MKKCDFCSQSDSNGNCHGVVGGGYCEQATKAYLDYMKEAVKSQNTRTKNVNVNKRNY